MAPLRILLALVVLLASVHGAYRNICEGRQSILRCGRGTKIQILAANYGRTNSGICHHASTCNTNCKAPGSLLKVKRLCNGKQACRLRANNAVFGDPCVGTYKYLRVAYRCIRPSSPKTVNICEHRRKVIGCGRGKVLSIIRANYGRVDRRTCHTKAIKTIRCYSRGSLGRARRLCNGKRACSLYASNRVYGDPCRGTYKYLRVTYRCIYPPPPIRRRSITCEGGIARLRCPYGRLRILKANYGRTSRRYCRRSNYSNTRCRSASSLAVVRRFCNRRSSCIFYATNRYFGDPCRGIYKYLDITYQC